MTTESTDGERETRSATCDGVTREGGFGCVLPVGHAGECRDFPHGYVAPSWDALRKEADSITVTRNP